jgi:hypothetical protein
MPSRKGERRNSCHASRGTAAGEKRKREQTTTTGVGTAGSKDHSRNYLNHNLNGRLKIARNGWRWNPFFNVIYKDSDNSRGSLKVIVDRTSANKTLPGKTSVRV